MIRILIGLILFTTELFAQSKFYWGSVVAMGASSSFDAGTSLYLNKYVSSGQLHETNGFLANSDGSFNTKRGIEVKCFVLATTVISEQLILHFVHKHYNETSTKKLMRTFGWINIGFAGEYIAVGSHNLSLR